MYSWDEHKSKVNRRKHGVSFEAAILVFDDPLHITRMERIENGERRWQTIGIAGDVAMLLVVHTWLEFDNGAEHVRIISARRVTKLERKIYEQNI